ncbi:unnamed protein product [Closterium sp. NIES-54]
MHSQTLPSQPLPFQPLPSFMQGSSSAATWLLHIPGEHVDAVNDNHIVGVNCQEGPGSFDHESLSEGDSFRDSESEESDWDSDDFIDTPAPLARNSNTKAEVGLEPYLQPPNSSAPPSSSQRPSCGQPPSSSLPTAFQPSTASPLPSSSHHPAPMASVGPTHMPTAAHVPSSTPIAAPQQARAPGEQSAQRARDARVSRPATDIVPRALYDTECARNRELAREILELKAQLQRRNTNNGGGAEQRHGLQHVRDNSVAAPAVMPQRRRSWPRSQCAFQREVAQEYRHGQVVDFETLTPNQRSWAARVIRAFDAVRDDDASITVRFM